MVDMEETKKIVGEEVETEEIDDELIDLDSDEQECVDDDVYEDGDDEADTVTKVINIVKQPVITQVIVGAEVDSKGAVKPMVKVSIERHLDGDIEIDEFDVIANDFEQLTSDVKIQIIALKEAMN